MIALLMYSGTRKSKCYFNQECAIQIVLHVYAVIAFNYILARHNTSTYTENSNVVVECLTHLLRILEVQGSNIVLEIGGVLWLFSVPPDTYWYSTTPN
jgi:hypothetical protein